MGRRLEQYAVQQVENEILADLRTGDGWQSVSSNRRRALFDAVVRAGQPIEWAEYLPASHPYWSEEDREWSLSDLRSDFWKIAKERIVGLPDGLLINKQRCLALFIEIEDTHPLTEEKLDRYADTFWLLDAAYWTTVLRVADRYGRNVRDIDLIGWSAAGTRNYKRLEAAASGS